MSWLDKLKEFIKINFKSKCFSSCCYSVDADIDIDVDGDKKPDIHIGIHDGEIEIKS